MKQIVSRAGASMVFVADATAYERRLCCNSCRAAALDRLPLSHRGDKVEHNGNIASIVILNAAQTVFTKRPRIDAVYEIRGSCSGDLTARGQPVFPGGPQSL
jgi:hypothetical protein